MSWLDRFRAEKLNPAQPSINEGAVSSKEFKHVYTKYYEKLEVVNRGVNMIVDNVSAIPLEVKGSAYSTGVVKGTRKVTLQRLVNEQPNPFMDINTFKRNLITDYLIDGNIFIYFDGEALYHLPADKVVIHGSNKNYVEKYTFNDITYYPDEIIHVKENSFHSIYRGLSRLKPALRSMQILDEMRTFQDNFFQNGAVPGLVIKSPNTLSAKIKNRLIESWRLTYNPKSGGKRPMILDGGLEVSSLNDVNFKNLDFQDSVETIENTICKALGVPPILLDSGNNANIRPNHRLFYLETIVPITNKLSAALSRFFGYEVVPDMANVVAMQPELKEQAAYFTSLVNGGILTSNEARDKLGYETLEGGDEIRIPANIAGSAADPSVGGQEPDESED